MLTKANYINTEKYEIELSIRMSVADWRELRSQLQERWPGGEVCRQIDEAVSKLTRGVMVTETSTL
jgi:hypothetical protein